VNGMRKVLALMAVTVLLAGSIPFFAGMNPASAQDNFEGFSPQLAEQIDEIYKQKQALSPLQRKIDGGILQIIWQIEELMNSVGMGEMPPFTNLSTILRRIDGAGNIEVKLNLSSLAEGQLEQLESLGMEIGITLPKYGMVEGSLPYDCVEAVAGLDFVTSIAPPGYAFHNTGTVDSEGDAVLGALEARDAFGVDGSGLKVGVISDGVIHLAASVAAGDLPASPAVDVLKEGLGDEGTAMLEIVHDLAPGAQLAFYGTESSSDMVLGITELSGAGCDIIVDDLIYLWDEPKFEDGPIAQEARAFFNSGGVYATCAGNYGDRHYMDGYSRTEGIFGYQYAHDYGGGDTCNELVVPDGGEVYLVLQWNNQWGQSADDFDIILFNADTAQLLSYGTDYQLGVGYDPREAVYWYNGTGADVTVCITILEWSLVSPPASMVLDYHIWKNFGAQMEYSVPENSVIGHGAIEEVLSTAASDAASPDVIEDFSSIGPGTVYFPAYEERQVPNITGVDGVQTKTGQLGHFYNPFYGTSASAPHVAAIAALVWEADPSLTPGEVYSVITSTAADFGPAGYDYTWGFGLADAYAAVASLAELPSVITDDASNIGEDSATLNGTLDSLGDYSSVDVSFEWGEVSGGPYPNETAPEEMTLTGSFSAPVEGLSPGFTYYYRAKATGSATVYGTEASFTTLSTLTGYDLPLLPGWNLVSLPLVPQSAGIEDVLAGIVDDVSSVYGVWAYNADTGTWSSSVPLGDPPVWAGDPIEMGYGRGYWIYVDEACTLAIEGTEPVKPCDIPLCSGWNLIGLPYLAEPQDIENLLECVVSHVSSVYGVWAYNADMGTWSSSVPLGDPPVWAGDLTEMGNGIGYWIYVDEACTLTIEGNTS